MAIKKFRFGEQSLKRISEVHPLLENLAKKTIALSHVDFGIPSTGGLRTAEEQNKIFKLGNSKCDGYKLKSYHQTGLALDIVPYIDGKFNWNSKSAFLEIHKAVTKAWAEIDQDKYHIHWGGFWGFEDLNKNSIIDLEDKFGWDCAHYELRPYRQIKGVHLVEV